MAGRRRILHRILHRFLDSSDGGGGGAGVPAGLGATRVAATCDSVAPARASTRMRNQTSIG